MHLGSFVALSFFFLQYLFGSTMVFLCANTCVVYTPVAIVAHEKSRVLSMLEEVVQFFPKGLIRLTFKDPADKYRLASQGSVMLDNIECSVTPSDRPNSLVYVHYFPAEGDDALLREEFRHYGKVVPCKHQYFSGRPNLLTGSRILTISMFRPIPAEVMVDVYRTRVWYRGMQPFCQICKTMGHKAADCEFYGKCKECGAADHRARDCPSRRGGRVWSSEPIVVKATVSPAVAETFPSIPVPEVAAAPPGVVVSEEVPDPSGVFIRSQ